jgi:hypothetical protein
VEKRERLNKMEAMLKQEEVAIGLLNAQAQEQMEKAKGRMLRLRPVPMLLMFLMQLRKRTELSM